MICALICAHGDGFIRLAGRKLSRLAVEGCGEDHGWEKSTKPGKYILLTSWLDNALGLNRKAAGELFSRHVNLGLKTMLSALGFDKNFVRAQGVSVFDDKGTKYLDFLGGYGVCPLDIIPKAYWGN